MLSLSQTVIQTKYIGPTNNRGSRIKAQLIHNGPSVTIGYPYELSGADCHLAAVNALCAKLGISGTHWLGTSFGNGYIFLSTDN